MATTRKWALGIVLFGGVVVHAACPDGASFDSALGFCADGTNAYGPFTKAMTDNCVKYGGGPACTNVNNYPVGSVQLSLQRWSVSFTRNLRGTGTCPTGAATSSYVDGLCAETINGVSNVYAGFAPALVSKCQLLNGGNACLSTRWNSNFYRKVAFEQRLRKNLTSAWSGSGLPSVSVTVSTPDQGYVYAATGVAAPSNVPVNPAVHQYRFASVSKNLTAALILRLQEAGYLNIDDKLSKHLTVPGLAYGSTMTIRQLMNHAAGVGNYLDYSDAFLDSTDIYGKIYTNNDVVGYINQVGAAFYPGSGYQYSNGGYFVLGLLIEKKLSMPIEMAFDQWLIKPLGLNNTFLDVSSNPAMKIPNLAESVRAYAYSTTSVKAAGALVSTTEDMAKYARAIYGGSFLSSTSLAAMKAPQANSSGYGLGTIIFTSPNGYKYYGHTGTLLNYKALVYFIPAANVSVALNTNDYPSSTAVLDRIKAAVYDTVSDQYGG
ncbi:serine hydrolase [Chitinimonas sp. BJYL2]|uniref:serine hydrolase domain-containing protein n=1 Tax=Chitinimonas sp. BJYL2 TaxID=2976696 RepID=UPI0022B31218|nr:serine hydrolase domain-containing protein [Chitinimonas sp. BJYL2]